MNIRNQMMLIIVALITTMFACNDDTLATTVDPDVQLEEDLRIIDEYISDKGLTNIDTTTNGARYTILDSGSGDFIEQNDIVAYHYAGRLTDGFLFASNIDTVHINNGSYDSTAIYSPIRYTYTGNGWNIPELYSDYRSREFGYREGVSKVLGVMRVGGRARIILPSNIAYGTSPPFSVGIPANAVLIFDIYPVNVK